jgi:hypothetical protein
MKRPPSRADTTVDGWDSEIIRLEEGNEYKEGVQGFKCSWAGTRIKGELSTLQFIDRKTQNQVVNDENRDDEVDAEASDEE